jgi:NADPH2 dehydrogenase
MKVSDRISIGGLELKNRIVMPPMNTELADVDGSVTDELVDHYAARAPWLGMVVVEHSYVRLDGKLSPHQPGIHADGNVEGFSRLAKAIRETGTPACIQINHAGIKCDAKVTKSTPVGPSATDGARELEIDEIDGIVGAFREAAARAASAGFDAVEVHGSHGFLLCEFTSPLANRREDRYGGSLENRARLPLEVVEGIREEISPDMQLWYRLGADDRTPGGNTLGDGVRIGRMLAAHGVDVLDVSGGMCGSRPPGVVGPGYFAYAAKAVKEASGLPVVAVGGITTPAEAQRVLDEWEVDLVAVGRALLKNPDWGKAVG